MKAIKSRINELHQGAEEIVAKYPSDEPLLKEVLNSVEKSFERLEALLKARAEKLGQVGNLQTVLCDMAEFEVKYSAINQHFAYLNCVDAVQQ